MDASQFNKYTDGLAQVEAQRIVEKKQVRIQAANSERLKGQIKQTTVCDGSNPSAVRIWIKEIELARKLLASKQTISLASRTVAGPLRHELERFISEYMSTHSSARDDVPWETVKEHISASFLHINEASALRDELEKTNQSAYEPEAGYNRRFREVADAAYPTADRNDDQNRILIRAYARGLRSSELARKLVEEGAPFTLEEHNGCCSIVPMTIKTTGPPISLPAYRTPLVKRKLVEEAVADMLAEGVIRPSSCPYASPVTLVPKKDGTTRFCVDYRKLNSVTVRDQYPLPQIQDIFDQIGGSTIFSTLDLKAGYWQLPMEEESIANRNLYLKPGPPLCGISGQSIDVKGVTQIKIDNTRTVVKVAVVGKMDHEMILGADNLRRGQGIINFRDDELFWHNKVWPLHRIGGLYVDSIGPLLPETGSQAVNKIVQRNSDIFSAKGEHNGCCSIVPMTIKTTGPPISLPAYRTPLVKRKLVEEAVADMLAEGVIRPSSSPYASPVTLVPKKDGTTRFCVDYRKLNSVTVRDQYPLPQIQDIFDQIGGSTIFSTLDLKAGYWQLPMEEESIAKTAFRCHMGHYEFLRMPFGFTNAPSVFQRTMDKVLASLIGKCVMVYIDDIVIYSENMDDHLAHIQLVFDCLRKAGLRLKPTKCSFGLPSVKLLGYIVNKDGIAADPEKIQAIQNLAPPTDIKGVRSFLGMTGFYRQCMSNYAAVAEPLETLKRKHAHFQWGTPQQNAFEQLKGLLTSSSVMAAPKINHPYKLYTDACEYAVGAILVQEDEKGVERVIQYISHSLSTTQRKWATIEKEAFAVVYAINKLRPYLYGAKFTVFTDHKPLTSLFTKDMQNTKIQRWGVLLAEYGAQIKYRAGKNNIRADMLSRIPPQREIATFDCDQWVDPAAIPDQRIEEQLPLLQDGFDMTIIVRDQEQEFAELRKRADNDDEENSYILINNALYSVRKPTPYSADYPRLVLPSAHQNTVIDRAHKEVGHMATEKTLDRLREAYVWPSMRKTIRERLRLCPVCQVHQRRSDHVPMGEMPLAQYPMQIVGADLIGPFVPSLSGNKYVLTIIDHCTGWVEAFPLPNKSNESVWNAWATQFVPRHGVPELLITDNGQEFCAKAWVDYLKKLGVIHHRTSPVHPQSNGRVERFNRTLKEMLALKGLELFSVLAPGVW